MCRCVATDRKGRGNTHAERNGRRDRSTADAPEAEKPVLPVVTEKKETEMPEDESALEVATEELPIPVPEIEDEAEAEQEYVPPTQTDSIPVQPTQPEPKSAPEPIANDNELADMVYVPGFGWIQSEGPNHVEYAEDMYENSNKIGTMG